MCFWCDSWTSKGLLTILSKGTDLGSGNITESAPASLQPLLHLQPRPRGPSGCQITAGPNDKQ
ncbi:hypothetical protein P7K49_003266 [Saguinus oedipus]|uniref:Uncharacterized protein n=1 Tax=Saguinus oedipus TaxID=9490 RepID=A0ABQ9WJP0_SAGOE|nr:hypothetical protein P7K49_003266 [Saguinus oedipus]